MIPPIVIPLAVAAVTGVVKGVRGVCNMKEAKRITQQANDRLSKSKTQLNHARKECNDCLTKLGQTKIDILDNSIRRFIAAFEKIKNYEFVTSDNLKELNDFVIDKAKLKTLKDEASYAASLAQGLITGSATGALVAYGAYSAVGFLGATTATSGGATVISSLSGAAAQNATLAWLGGGAISVGGAGIAGGTMVLGSLMIAPALLVGGFIISAKGSKALDEAKTNYAKAKKASAEIDTARTLCNGISRKCKEFIKVLNELNRIFIPQIERLENLIKESGTDYASICLEDKHAVAKAYATAGAIKAVLDTPILSKDGKMTAESTTTINKLRDFLQQN